ncbi:hypothetical protein L1D14_07235 [Vibrio tubiashii]|uniref:hypothetical protein n=1 Tax=Vibrio tubiashii TaxID=29498 RepID=UPI001EFD044F|nr:hypothetical protein [Vibrio tubiashii]MCG9576030.1 hypothetical protein [Vibrio tubiashii]
MREAIIIFSLVGMLSTLSLPTLAQTTIELPINKEKVTVRFAAHIGNKLSCNSTDVHDFSNGYTVELRVGDCISARSKHNNSYLLGGVINRIAFHNSFRAVTKHVLSYETKKKAVCNNQTVRETRSKVQHWLHSQSQNITLIIETSTSANNAASNPCLREAFAGGSATIVGIIGASSVKLDFNLQGMDGFPQ